MGSTITVFILLLFVGLPVMWFLITGIILLSTGRYITIFHLIDYIIFKKHYIVNRDIYTKILQNKFKYYSDLPNEYKDKFIKRVSDFVASKEFILLPDTKATIEQKVLISAAAIQVTFGLDKFLLEHFSKIFIYSKAYLSKLDNKFHLGEVNLQGAIVLSLEDFFYGYEHPSCGINVGIHEMAHALSLELMLKDDYEEFFKNYFIKWKQSADVEFMNLKQRKESFLRQYAKTNMVEFFAVCLENFFERPQEFKSSLPELYERLTILLNQDPLDDFRSMYNPRTRLSANEYKPFNPDNFIFKLKLTYLKNLLLPVIFSFVAIIIILCNIHNLSSSVIVASLNFFISVFVVTFIFLATSKTFYIYDNCLVVKSILSFNSAGNIYTFERIMFISLLKDREGQLRMSFISNGRCKVREYIWFSNKIQLKEFLTLLVQKKVVVKNFEP